ncbi:MAG: LysM peptidoglycan-binding domain-containing protein [Planctomycetes bacterium]|nr:LysM peptidoglycan-binding domain-containing protein [Planctomycetota bacterium]
METHGGKIAAGLLCLVIVWIIVFWLWTPTEGKISFSTADAGKVEQTSDDQATRPRLSKGVVEVPVRPEPRPVETRPAPAKPSSKSSGPSGNGGGTAGGVGGGGVVAPEFIEYTVQPGDTFASIALKYLGSRSKADLIAAANPLMDPTRIRAGRVIKVPKDPANIQGKPTKVNPNVDSSGAPAARTHTVAKGETLTAISQKYYGTIKRIDLILSANKAVLARPEDLKPGQVLQIPPAPQ